MSQTDGTHAEEKHLTIAYIGVGSNLGSRENNIEKSRTLLAAHPKIRFIRSAPVYETKPVDGPPQGNFLNTVWEIETDLSPMELMSELLLIEKSLGRERVVQNGPRTIDLDILFYGQEVMQRARLVIPHPRAVSRWFVLKPLSDLVPEFMHPILNRKISDLLRELHACC